MENGVWKIFGISSDQTDQDMNVQTTPPHVNYCESKLFFVYLLGQTVCHQVYAMKMADI